MFRMLDAFVIQKPAPSIIYTVFRAGKSLDSPHAPHFNTPECI
jgi:hypothetical protein